MANQGRPQCSMLGDVAKRRVRGQWQAGETSSTLNIKRRGREEGSGEPGEASSMVDVG